MSSRRYLRIALCLVAALAAGEALAGKKKGKGKKSKAPEASSYQAPYGMAGCGLGSVVIKSDTAWPQVTAVTLNGIGMNQISAISCSKSSNCGEPKPEVARQEQQVFIASNLASLEKDMSAGGGQFAEAFAQVLGCTDNDEYARLLAVSRANYARIFSNVDSGLVYDQYMQVLRSDEILAKGCERILITAI
jgi:hypothetical protein